MKKLNKKGFTLVELIVVIVIIGILAAILIPNLGKWIEQARMTKEESEATAMVKDYYAEAALQDKAVASGLKLYVNGTNYRFYYVDGGIDTSKTEKKEATAASGYSELKPCDETTKHYMVGSGDTGVLVR